MAPAPSTTQGWLVAWIDRDGQAHERICSEQDLWFLVMSVKQSGCHNVRWRRI